MISYLIYYFYRFWVSLWRVTVILDPQTEKMIENREPVILAHWHGDEYSLIHLVKKFKLATMTSTSRDGDRVDFVIRKFGGVTTRGSSTRGGISALKGLIRLSKEGRIVSIAIDGPRGPIYQPKPGVFELSRLCKAAIIPVGVAVDRAFKFEKSWNKAYLPLPFSRVYLVFDSPIPALTSEDDPKNFQLSLRLGEQMAVARRRAANYIAAPQGEC